MRCSNIHPSQLWRKIKVWLEGLVNPGSRIAAAELQKNKCWTRRYDIRGWHSIPPGLFSQNCQSAFQPWKCKDRGRNVPLRNPLFWKWACPTVSVIWCHATLEKVFWWKNKKIIWDIFLRCHPQHVFFQRWKPWRMPGKRHKKVPGSN